MKVLFVIKAMDDASGGAERVLANISAGLADHNHDVSLLSFESPGGQSFYPLHDDIERIKLGIGNVKNKTTFPEILVRMAAIRKEVKRSKPDIVISFMHSAFIPTAFALIGTGVPIIASEHIVPEHYKKRFAEYILFLASSLFVKKITVLSQTIIENYTPFLRRKMVPMANPVFKAKHFADPAGDHTSRKRILNVGRLTAQKDQETLIKAFAILAPDYPEWDVRIVGEGGLEDNLKATIREHNLENRVTLAGSTSEIGTEYQAAHIFALPSTYESFGLATAEAMAHGLPAIGFADCPGTNELISHDQDGLLVQGSDRIAAFAQGLKTLMDSHDLRAQLGLQARERIKPFHLDAITKK